jgi:hypothetical protein
MRRLREKNSETQLVKFETRNSKLETNSQFQIRRDGNKGAAHLRPQDSVKSASRNSPVGIVEDIECIGSGDIGGEGLPVQEVRRALNGVDKSCRAFERKMRWSIGGPCY